MRNTLFLGLCIPSRVALAFAAEWASSASGPTSVALTLVLATMAVGFATIYFMGWRKTGGETFGQPIWWNYMRPVHSALYAAAAYSVAAGEGATARNLILFDAAIGLAAFVHNRL